jgi:hypothetical protein
MVVMEESTVRMIGQCSVVEQMERQRVGDEVLDDLHGCYLLCSKVDCMSG